MALTRANAESIIIRRCGPLMAKAGMDGTTVDGTNADLNDPIGRAVRDLGYTVTDVVAIVDADVAQIAASQYDEFLDSATLHTLESIITNLDDVDITVGPRSESLNQLAERVEKRKEQLKSDMAEAYGYGLAVPEAGYITKEFVEHDDG